MSTITSINISVTTSGLITKIRRNLAIIGKRARRTNGESMYSDITASNNEEPLYDDLLMFGAQTVVSNLSDLCTAYVETDTDSTVNGVVAFTLISARINSSDSIQNILKGLIEDYLYNFVLARYLSEIHPSTGDKYPPLFGKTYTDACDTLMVQIRTIAFLKRPKEGSDSLGYNSVGMNSTSVTVDGDEETPVVTYYTKAEVDSLLSAKQNVINDAYKVSLLSGYATLSDVSTISQLVTALSLRVSALESQSTYSPSNSGTITDESTDDTEESTEDPDTSDTEEETTT